MISMVARSRSATRSLVVAAALCLGAVSAEGGEPRPRMGEGEQAITSASRREYGGRLGSRATVELQAQALVRSQSRGAVGSAVFEATIVDRAPLGESREVDAVVVVLDDVVLHKSDVGGEGPTSQYAMTLTVLLGPSDGRLVAAFSEPHPVWVLPERGVPGSVEELAWELGWQCTPAIPGEHARTLREVLQTVWATLEKHPMMWGQVTVRPRRVARRVGLTETGPEFGEPEPAWIVELRGVAHRAPGGGYFSGCLVLLTDPELQEMVGFLE